MIDTVKEPVIKRPRSLRLEESLVPSNTVVNEIVNSTQRLSSRHEDAFKINLEDVDLASRSYEENVEIFYFYQGVPLWEDRVKRKKILLEEFMERKIIRGLLRVLDHSFHSNEDQCKYCV